MDTENLKTHKDLKKIAQKRLNNFKDKILFHYQTSLSAPNLLPNELDFVYIDADHNYQAVKADIAAWFPKVKNGGVLGGHDIAWDGVFWAVEEFVKINNLRLFVDDCDWWIVKGISWIEKMS